MATNHIRLGINYRQNKNEKSSAYGKYYAEIDRRETLTTAGLAAHLAEHNFGMGEDAIYAMLTRLSKCIPELLAQGVPVKIDGLGIFSTTLKSMGQGLLYDSAGKIKVRILTLRKLHSS